MADVVTWDRHPGLADTTAAAHGPVYEMVSNSDFSFPARPQPRKPRTAANVPGSTARPASAYMHIDIPRADPMEGHRRTVSTLPSFSFNATDNSGLHENEQQPRTPDESVAVTPSRRGHRRGGSEFVGGDSRLGVSVAVSSSPTKTPGLSELPTPATAPPAGRRGHAHRRSAAISSHDITKLMQPSMDVQPRLSSSLPNTPLERTVDMPLSDTSTKSPEDDSEASDPFGPPLDTTAAKAPSRPRVGFSDNVEFIPRPLSTISSDTESSMSTVRGHSVNNSISSMLSLGTPSPPSSRAPVMLFGTTRERVSSPPVKSSLEISKRVEREGQWLRRRSSESLKRPLSESAEPRTTIKFTEQKPDGHRRKLSLSQALGFDRRRSEPSISLNTTDLSRLSALSLQESTSSERSSPDTQNSNSNELKSSARKIKDWAASKISKKAKEAKEALMSSSTSSIRPESAGSMTVPGKVSLPEPVVAETDLDAVFSNQDTAVDAPRPLTPGHSRVEVVAPSRHSYSAIHDDTDAVLDLDAALGPFKTPPIGSYRARKELHSNRLTKDFNGPGGHYHRRSESAPNLPPFEDAKTGPVIMAEVCEEEEDEQDVIDAAPSLDSRSISSRQEMESGVGIQIVDVHTTTNAVSPELESDDGLDILQTWESEPSISSLGTTRAIFSHAVPENRGSCVIEHTIMEETGSLEDVEIVEDDEEPRISSQTKSSDSSDTPTVIPTQIATLTLPDGQQSLMTPETYQSSIYSSPALRPGSFDTNRLDTSASSITDNRTLSSFAASDHHHDLRVSVDVPSLTSSRSTMISSVPGNHSRGDFSNTERSLSTHSQLTTSRDPSERRRKRSSIQSLSQLVGSPFGPRSKGFNDARPDTSNGPNMTPAPKKKDHRLKKLMFWKSKDSSNRLSLPAS